MANYYKGHRIIRNHKRTLEELYRSKLKRFGDELKLMMADRANLLQAMDMDPAIAAAERELSQRDIFHFIENHVWIYEPRTSITSQMGLKVNTFPLKLFDYQRDIIKSICEHIDKGRDLLIEKSRDMGLSWLVLIIFAWYFLKNEGGNDFLIGSRKMDYVDKKSARDSLFEKMRFVMYNLHPSLLPPGFSKLKHDNVGLIANPYAGNYMRGESNNANFGTSGRYKAILVDEFSKWEETDESAWTSMGDSSPCRIAVSTPWGMGTKFAQLRFSGAIDVMTVHWTLHPFKRIGLYEDEQGKKRSYWYDLEVERRKDNPNANISQELDIDYLQSGTPYFDNRIISKRIQELQSNPPKLMSYSWRREDENTVEIFANPAGEIKVLKPPASPNVWEYRYIISADVAQGLEKGDESSFYVFDRVEKKDVCWYSGHITTDAFALLLITIAKWYYGAWIGPEANNNGHAVIQKMKPLYHKIMHRRNFEYEYDVEDEKLGWITSGVTRPIMLSQLRELLDRGQDGINDIKFFKEAMTFIYNKGGRAEAASGKLDDCVMAQAIKFQLHQWVSAPKRKEKVIDENEKDYQPKEDYERAEYVPEPEGWV